MSQYVAIILQILFENHDLALDILEHIEPFFLRISLYTKAYKINTQYFLKKIFFCLVI